MAKNNLQERLRKMESKRDHYAIRKLSVGAASVLIGVSFWGLGKSQVVKADEADQQPQTAAEQSDTNKPAVADSVQLGRKNADKSASEKTDKQGVRVPAVKTAKANKALKPKVKVRAKKRALRSVKTSKAVKKHKAVKTGAKTSLRIKKHRSAKTSFKVKTVQREQGQGDPDKLGSLLGSELFEDALPTQVNTADQLKNALNDANVKDIQLNGNIDLSAGLTISDSGSARALTIEGKDNSGVTRSLNFGTDAISFANATVGNAGWNITLKNLKIEAGSSNKSPFDYSRLTAANQQKSAITFDNVTANLNGRSLTKSEGQVNFIGNNRINERNLQRGQNVVEANSVAFISGKTIFYADGSIYGTLNSDSPDGDVIRATSNDSKAVNIAAGASVEINSDSADVRGIVAGYIAPLSPYKQEGEVYVAGNLNESLANGHSSAIWAGNLNIDGGAVGIKTKQDNQADGVENSWVNGVTNYNGYHYAPISLGSNGHGTTSNTDPSLRIDQQGSLKIVRSGGVQTLTPLIAFGDGGTQDNSTQSLYVGSGSTLDLQDNAASFDHSVTNPDTPKQGLITMFGPGSRDTVIFDNPAFVNLQRTGSIYGTLLRIEGKKSSNTGNMQVVVNGTTPIAQWNSGSYSASPSYLWHVNNLQTQNGWGDYADKFVKHGYNANDFLYSNLFNTTDSFQASNGLVTLAADETNKKSQFENNFNWWTAQRIAIGSKLDSDSSFKDQARYQGTRIKQGQTTTVAAPTITRSDNTNGANDVASYAAGTGIQPWATVNSDGTISLAPTEANSTANTMYNVPVLITYKNNTTETVYAPVYVTNDDNHHVIWGNAGQGAVVFVTQPVTLHQTSDNTMVTAGFAKGAVKEFDLYGKDAANPDKISSTPDVFNNANGQFKDSDGNDLGDVSVAWSSSPSTIVTAPSLTTPPITQQIIVTFNAGSLPVSGGIFAVGTTSGTLAVKLNLSGAVDKTGNPQIQVEKGQQPTSDQLAQLVDHSNLDMLPDGIAVDHYEVSPLDTTFSTSSTGTQDVIIRIVFKDKDSSSNPTYLDLRAITDGVKVVDNDAAKYPVKYDDMSLKRPNDESTQSKDEDATLTAGMPSGTITGFAVHSGFTAPSNVSVTIASDGKATVTVNKKSILGSFEVPVDVTYTDGSSDTVYLKVSVTGQKVNPGGDTTYYGNQTMTRFRGQAISLHKTSIDHNIDPAQSAFQTIDVYTDWDGQGQSDSNYHSHVRYELTARKNGSLFYQAFRINADGSQTAEDNLNFDADKISYQWREGYTPNTNFGDKTASTLYRKADGTVNDAEQTSKGDNLPGNSKWRYNFTVAADVASQLHVGSDPMWANVYFNFYGAETGHRLQFHQGDDVSNLTQAQFRSLINVSDLGVSGWNGTNINPNAPQVLAYVPGNNDSRKFSMDWAPGTGENGQPSTETAGDDIPGTVRIFFSDGTYLDVKARIRVLPTSPDPNQQTFSQKIVYMYNGREVAYTTIGDISRGDSLTAARLRSAIDANVPNNYQIKSGYAYPAEIDDIQADPAIIYVPLMLRPGISFGAHGKIVYQLADGTHIADGTSIDSNVGDTLTAGLLHDYADQGLPAGYHIVTYPGSYNVTADGFTIPVIIAADNNNPGGDNPGGGGNHPGDNPGGGDKPNKPNKPNKPGKPGNKPDKKGNHHPGKKGDRPDSGGRGRGRGKRKGGGWSGNGGRLRSSKKVVKSSVNKLPQTGEADGNQAGLAGLILTAVAGLFGFAYSKKRKH